MKKMLFVYNPNSGKGAVKDNLSDILSIFTAGGYDVTVHPTSAARDGQNYISENAVGYDIVVTSGGDGMLHELVNGIIISEANIQCGYIPSGTVNDFAASLNIPKDMSEAAKMILNGNFIPVDAGSFNSNYFGYVAAFGMFTDVSYATDQKSKNFFGSAAYLFNIIKSMDLKTFMTASKKMKICYDNHIIIDDFIFGFMGNTFSVAGMKNLVPDSADMNDGLLDGVFIKTPKTIPELESIKISFINKTFDSTQIVNVKSDNFEIFCPKGIDFTLDGEFGGNCSEVCISAKKSAYRIAVPRNQKE